jgi:molecular chaperone HscA
MLYRNTPIPATSTKSYTTAEDGQSGLEIHVVQGERERAEDNRALATFVLEGIPPLPAGIPRIDVTFTVDADGLLTVRAQEMRTGVAQHITVHPRYGLTDAMQEAMVRESLTHGQQDMAWRLWQETCTEATRTLHALDTALATDLGLLEDAQAHALCQAMDDVRACLDAHAHTPMSDTATAQAARTHVQAAMAALRPHEEAFAALRIKTHVTHALHTP